MKTAIVYVSYHHMNTEKIAQVLAAELGADLFPIGLAQQEIDSYDLVGFGSGIYGRKFHKTLIQFVTALPTVSGKRAFVFSTSGRGHTRFHTALKGLLVKRGFSIVGDFACKGWDTVGPLKLFGGINKQLPNSADFEQARTFAEGLKER